MIKKMMKVKMMMINTIELMIIVMTMIKMMTTTMTIKMNVMMIMIKMIRTKYAFITMIALTMDIDDNNRLCECLGFLSLANFICRIKRQKRYNLGQPNRPWRGAPTLLTFIVATTLTSTLPFPRVSKRENTS